ncbi:MAG TPA: hypothetical protein VFZ08_06485 [Terriglobia bacterium]|nr:hypothetical protein [Terriglobia bacterium]
MENTKPNSNSPSEPPAEEKSNAGRRRSTRLSIAVPVTISGQNTRGEMYREETRTVVVNRQGACISTAQRLAPDLELTIENPPLRIAVRGRIIHVSDPAPDGDSNEIGVELVESKNVWGIQYPPADWRQANVTPAQPPPAAMLKSDAPPSAETDSTDPAPSGACPQAQVFEVELPAIFCSANSSNSPSGRLLPPTEPNPRQEIPAPDQETERTLQDARTQLVRLGEEIQGRLRESLQSALRKIDARQEENLSAGPTLAASIARAEECCGRLEQLLLRIERARQEAVEESESLESLIPQRSLPDLEHTARRQAQS